MRTHARLLRSIVLAALVTSLGACTTWSRRPVAAPGEDRFFATARVTRGEEPPILLDSVTVGRDSVVGTERAGARARVAIPVSEVRMVEARRSDPVGTVMVVVVPILAAVVLWASDELRKLGTDY